MNKIFWLDCETTGLDSKKNDIFQLAYLCEVDGVIKDEGEILFRPLDLDNISPEALEITGKTVEELASYPDPKESFNRLLQVLDRFVYKFDKADKCFSGGYNVPFDMDFLQDLFIKMGHRYFGSYFNRRTLDAFQLLNWLVYTGEIDLINYKLGTLCAHYGIDISAHDAVSDIKATRELTKRLLKHIYVLGDDLLTLIK